MQQQQVSPVQQQSPQLYTQLQPIQQHTLQPSSQQLAQLQPVPQLQQSLPQYAQLHPHQQQQQLTLDMQQKNTANLPFSQLLAEINQPYYQAAGIDNQYQSTVPAVEMHSQNEIA